MTDPAALDLLTSINAKDLLFAFGISDTMRGYRWLSYWVRPIARRFARQVLAYDADVGRIGLARASAGFLKSNVGSVMCTGEENLAGEGPLLIASNHPGMTDAMALFTALGSNELRIVARDRDFLRALPNIMAQLLIVPENSGDRFGTARAIASALKSGQPVLTFPAGKIEPDPHCMPGAVDSLNTWSESLDLFVRLVPGLRVVPAVVSGVISAAALRNPVTRIRRTTKDRNWLAATLQVVLRAYQTVNVRVVFGEPVRATPSADEAATQAVTRRVIARAARMIEGHYPARPDLAGPRMTLLKLHELHDGST